MIAYVLPALCEGLHYKPSLCYVTLRARPGLLYMLSAEAEPGAALQTKDGRISMAGLNSARAEYLAKAIDDSVRNY